MITLKEIAIKSGVSVSTASRALRNDTRISLETRYKVEGVAEKEGYIKHKLKKNIEENHLEDIGLIVPEVLSGYYARLVQVAQNSFAKVQYSVLLKITNFDSKEMVKHIYSFGRMGVKCLLIVMDDSEEISNEIFVAVKAIKRPTLFVTTKYLADLDFDGIYLDEVRGIAMGIEHLVQRGYKKIAYVGEEKTFGRLRAYEEAMKNLGMNVDKNLVMTSKERAEEGGYVSMKKMLDQDTIPDAVFASYDEMAIGVISAILEAGLSVPDDIGVLGFDDVVVSKYIQKGITTIQNPCEDMISIAVRVLMNRVQNRDAVPQQIALKPALIKRGTT